MNDQSHNKQGLWYIKKQEKVTGPFPVKLIGSYLILGRIDIDTLVSTDKDKWIPIGRLPSLIPDEVKHLSSAHGKDHLHQAKLREDERRGDSRRNLEDRPEPDQENDNRRQSNDRRQNDEKISEAYLKLKADISENRNKAKKLKVYGVSVLIVVLVALLTGFLLTDPMIITTKTDCLAAAAPGVDWRSCNKNSVDLISKNLQQSNLHSANLTGALLVRSNLTEADLSYANFENANLSQANLQNALLTGANLNNANLTGTGLSGADLSYADLRNAKLSNVRVLNTRFDNAIWIDGSRCARPSIDQCMAEIKP